MRFIRPMDNRKMEEKERTKAAAGWLALDLHLERASLVLKCWTVSSSVDIWNERTIATSLQVYVESSTIDMRHRITISLTYALCINGQVHHDR